MSSLLKASWTIFRPVSWSPTLRSSDIENTVKSFDLIPFQPSFANCVAFSLLCQSFQHSDRFIGILSMDTVNLFVMTFVRFWFVTITRFVAISE